MLRELRIADAPRRLLERSGAELVPLPRPDLCCGFGGTFSVRQPEVSLAMADDKLGRRRRRRTRSSRPTRAASCTSAAAPSTKRAASPSSTSRPRSPAAYDA